MHPEWKRQTGEKRSSNFLHLQELTSLPVKLPHIREVKDRTHSERKQLPMGKFWQTGVTSPGDCQPSSPTPGTAGAQPPAWLLLFAQSTQDRSRANLCRHPSARHVPQETHLTTGTLFNVISLWRKTSSASTLALYLAGVGLPDNEVLSILSIFFLSRCWYKRYLNLQGLLQLTCNWSRVKHRKVTVEKSVNY